MPYNDPRVIFDKDPDEQRFPVTYGQGLDIGEFALSATMWKSEKVPWRSGVLFGRGGSGLKYGLKTAFNLAPLVALDMVLSTATAPPKHRAAALGGAIAAQVTGLVAGAIGFAIGGPVAAVALNLAVDPIVRRAASEGVQKFIDFGRDIQRVRMGGEYEDTEVAWTMRQRAAVEIGNSLLNARQYLGKEASLMHE